MPRTCRIHRATSHAIGAPSHTNANESAAAPSTTKTGRPFTLSLVCIARTNMYTATTATKQTHVVNV